MTVSQDRANFWETLNFRRTNFPVFVTSSDINCSFHSIPAPFMNLDLTAVVAQALLFLKKIYTRTFQMDLILGREGPVGAVCFSKCGTSKAMPLSF